MAVPHIGIADKSTSDIYAADVSGKGDASKLGMRFDAQGRRRCSTTANPTVAAGAGAGVGATAVLTAGSDEHGTITVTTAGTPAAGTLATVTFAVPFSVTPSSVQLTAGDVHGAAAQLYFSVSTTALTVKFAGSLSASQAIVVSYTVVGGE